MNKTLSKKLLADFDFKTLFLDELGWDNFETSSIVQVDEEDIELQAIAEKRGMGAYLCRMPEGGYYDYRTRCKIETQLAREIREHIIIFADSCHKLQIWQWVKREPGKPIARREHAYNIDQSGEALLQKLEVLKFTLEEEEELTLFNVTSKTREAFDLDRVTRRFYDRFKVEHAAFLKQIQGIDDKGECEWYTSIMLNRLKFIYFIQKKGFLDNDHNYLRNKLILLRRASSSTNFLSFYRAFLLKLFHDGLGRKEHSPELRALLGTVPYLNGGIFAVHPLEEKYPDIDIPDEAFVKILDFFDQYQWHLDERPLRRDDEINPDVLGYIFEKYINQKQMGAYYTKEDITEYISKNCILPFILDRVESDLSKKASLFNSLFDQLSHEPDRYIYEAVSKGVNLPLPPEIAKGVDTTEPELLERRAEWNKAASDDFALPTETWREVVARRRHYWEVRSRLTGLTFKEELIADPECPAETDSSPPHNIGNPVTTNDLITFNLDIRQFVQDCIENAATPDVLWSFWQAIEQITVLDPTCGSGAFLFAALNILEPLYAACLDRMKAFMLEWSQAPKAPHPNYYRDFAAVIARVDEHANEKYFIFKSIIIRNLYGVDIMDEAVEICKLRLFLKLAAQIEPDYNKVNLGIEPLPDIDFNVRAGNTLVGFATEKQAEDVICQDLLNYNTVWPEVQREAKEIAELFALFRQQQTELGGAISAEDKQQLRNKLKPLELILNSYLAGTYGISGVGVPPASLPSGAGVPPASLPSGAGVPPASLPANTSSPLAIQTHKPQLPQKFTNWLLSHNPFHWFIEFYEIMARGGFDVIIGNPPYVSSAKVIKTYSVKGYKTLKCPDIYAWCQERVTQVIRPIGYTGMIVPLSLSFSSGFDELRDLIYSSYGNNWFSSFGRIPAALFAHDVRVRNTIHLASRVGTGISFTTRLHRWYESERDNLLSNMTYCEFTPAAWNKRIPKLNTQALIHAFEKKLVRVNRLSNYISRYPTNNKLYFKKTAYNWLNFCREMPPCSNANGKPIDHTQFDHLYINAQTSCDIIFQLLNGKLEFAFWIAVGDDFHVAKWMFADFPFDTSCLSSQDEATLSRSAIDLENAMLDAVSFKLNAGKKVGNYNLARCREVTDKSDLILARALGFDHVWEDIELLYVQCVRTDFNDESD